MAATGLEPKAGSNAALQGPGVPPGPPAPLWLQHSAGFKTA
jgi:hypothetical protein